jgi:hypothetical protein
MAHGHGCVALQEQVGERFADDGRAPDDCDVTTAHGDTVVIEQFDD